MKQEIKILEVPLEGVRVDDFIKDISETRKGFDYDKITDTFKNFGVYILLSERSLRAKTEGAVQMCVKDYLKNKRISRFIRTTYSSLESEAEGFLNPIRKSINPDFFENTKMVSKGGRFSSTFNGDEWLQLWDINSASKMKGSRTPINNIVFDEINEDNNKIRGDMGAQVESILQSSFIQEYNTRTWILSNNKGINNKYMMLLGVRHNLYEVSAFYALLYIDGEFIGKVPYCVKFCAKYTEEEKKSIIIKKFKEKDQKFIISMITGQAGHSYFNETYEDEEINIVPYHLFKFQPKSLSFTFKIDKHYFNMYEIDETKWHCALLKDIEGTSDNIITTDQKEITENVVFVRQIKDFLQNKLSNNDLTFQDIGTRVLFIDFLIKK